jgi:hypothetical protein
MDRHAWIGTIHDDALLSWSTFYRDEDGLSGLKKHWGRRSVSGIKGVRITRDVDVGWRSGWLISH